MYKNQLQELAQRSCFNLPSYACIREGPDHAPRFKATVTFNGETFESPNFCSTLRQAEHAAAEVALNTLSKKGPTQSLAARILDETGVCKNLLQETAQRAGVRLPGYTTVRSGPGHLPVFTCTVELAGMSFTGEAAKTKKQAEKNAAMAAWSSLKQLVSQGGSSSQSSELDTNEEQEQIIIARALAKAYKDDKSHMASVTQQSPQMHQASHSQAHSRFSGPSSTRIKILPFQESSGQSCTGMQAPYNSAPWISMDLNADPIPGQRYGPSHQQGSVIVKTGSSYHPIVHRSQHLSPGLVPDAPVFPREANTTSRVSASSGGSMTRPLPVQVQTVPFAPRRDRHAVSFSLQEHQRDDEEWFRGETSTVVISSENSDLNATDGGLPLVQGSFNHMIWSHPNQWLNMEPHQTAHHAATVFRAATSLAPPVRVRQMVAVCSAPPRRPEPEDQENDSKEAEATRQVLSQLRL